MPDAPPPAAPPATPPPASPPPAAPPASAPPPAAPPPAAPPPAAAPPTGAGSGDGSVGALWTADWRTGYASGDEGKLNVLNRYASPKDLLDAHFALKQKVDSGQAKAGLPKDATPEQVAVWRKENGIPEKPDGYLANLPPEIHLEESDKALVEPYLAAMHELNLPPAVAQKLLAVRAQSLDKMVDARVQADQRLTQETVATMQKEWGGDYNTNLNAILNMFQGAPEDVREAFLSARTPDGNALVGTVGAMRWLGGLARQMGFVGPVIMGPSGAPLEGKGIDDRIGELNRWMSAPKGSADYNRYWNDQGAQKEYRDLIDAKDAQKRRAAA